MSCYGCCRKYGLFCKEYGCPNCGYSYCARCLKRSISVPRANNKICNVCLICFDKLSKLQASEKVIDIDMPPQTMAGMNRISAKSNDANDFDGAEAILAEKIPTNLDDVLQPLTSDKKSDNNTNNSIAENSDIAENLDTVITKRLKDLKTLDTNTNTTDDDIRVRLANLSDMPVKDYKMATKDLLLNTDQRTDQEKTRDLLEQFLGETAIDNRIENERIDAISDIERRLRALRDAPIDDIQQTRRPNETNTPSDNEEESEETMLRSIIDKYLQESRLPEVQPNVNDSGIMMTESEGEELPWCNVCNEDAVYRCKDCDGDLFCAQCFNECHGDDDEYRIHVKEPYSVPPKFKDDHFVF